jgi:hypothetical protein
MAPPNPTKGTCAILDLPQFLIDAKWNWEQLERCNSAQAELGRQD